MMIHDESIMTPPPLLRRFYSSSQCTRDKIRNYLEGWIGQNTNNNPNAVKSSLTLSALSYLIPTFRPNRKDHALELTTAKHHTTSPKIPIVLDLGSYLPDGSPHYTPPTRIFVQNLLNKLDAEHNLKVLALTNAPPNLRMRHLPQLKPSSRAAVGRLDLVELVREMAVDSDAAEEVDRADKSVNDEETARMEVPVSVSPSVEPPVEPPVEPQESNTLQNLESDSQTPAFPAIYIHNESVRSGQQVSPPHRGQSLLILGSVNSGAEVLADADIVVLGKLRGRALAGLGEANNSAKIVAHGFQPELIGIGTVVTTDLEFPWLGQAATVQIDPHDATRLWIQPIATL